MYQLETGGNAWFTKLVENAQKKENKDYYAVSEGVDVGLPRRPKMKKERRSLMLGQTSGKMGSPMAKYCQTLD